MIKHHKETQDNKLTSKINDMTRTDSYSDAAFTVHADTKIHMEGVLTMGKGATQTI